MKITQKLSNLVMEEKDKGLPNLDDTAEAEFESERNGTSKEDRMVEHRRFMNYLKRAIPEKDLENIV